MTRAGRRAWAGPNRLPVTVPVAVVVVVVGLVATLVRPTAPGPGTVATDLDRLPAALADAIARYRGPRVVAALVLDLVALAVPVVAVATRTGRRLIRVVAVGGGSRWPAPVRGAAIGALVAGATRLVGMPIAAWAGIVQDGAWQVRTASAGAWWGRLAVSTLIDIALVAAVGAGLTWLVRRRPRWWWADVVGLGVVTVALVTLLWPVAVLPLTTPVHDLGEGPAPDAVRQTLTEAGFGDLPVVVTERSARDVRRNAVVHGLGPTRRVVVDDTLLERPVDEVVAVVAHELAHQRHRDVERGVLGAAVVVVVLAAAVHLAWARARARGLVAGPPHDPRLVAVALAVAAVLTPVVQPVALWQSRRVEAAADAAALELGATPATTIRLQRRLAIDNLQPLAVPTWQQLWWSSHPTGAQRIRAAVARARITGQALPDRSVLEAAEAADPPAWEPPDQR